MKAPSNGWLVAGVLVLAAWFAWHAIDEPPPGRIATVVKVQDDGQVCVAAGAGRSGECGEIESGEPVEAGDCVRVAYSNESYTIQVKGRADCPVP